MQLTLIWVLHHRHRSLLVLTYHDDSLVYIVGKVAKHRKIIVTVAVVVFVTLVMVTMVIVMVVKVVVMLDIGGGGDGGCGGAKAESRDGAVRANERHADLTASKQASGQVQTSKQANT